MLPQFYALEVCYHEDLRVQVEDNKLYKLVVHMVEGRHSKECVTSPVREKDFYVGICT